MFLKKSWYWVAGHKDKKDKLCPLWGSGHTVYKVKPSAEMGLVEHLFEVLGTYLRIEILKFISISLSKNFKYFIYLVGTLSLLRELSLGNSTDLDAEWTETLNYLKFSLRMLSSENEHGKGWLLNSK